jgi:hypothetical protein
MLERAVGHLRDRSGGIEAALDEFESPRGSPPGDKRFAVASGIEISIDGQQVRVSRMPP